MRKPHIVVFTQEGCGPCQLVKMYIEQKGVDCEVLQVETDIDRELLKRLYPYVLEAGFPFVTVDGSWVPDLINYYESGL